MGDGLALKSGLELSEREVRHKSRDYESRDAFEQVAVPYHDKVAHRADGAEARALREPADYKAAPGPLSEKNIGPVPFGPSSGRTKSRISIAAAKSGMTSPAAFGVGRDGPRLKPP